MNTIEISQIVKKNICNHLIDHKTGAHVFMSNVQAAMGLDEVNSAYAFTVFRAHVRNVRRVAEMKTDLYLAACWPLVGVGITIVICCLVCRAKRGEI